MYCTCRDHVCTFLPNRPSVGAVPRTGLKSGLAKQPHAQNFPGFFSASDRTSTVVQPAVGCSRRFWLRWGPPVAALRHAFGPCADTARLHLRRILASSVIAVRPCHHDVGPAFMVIFGPLSSGKRGPAPSSLLAGFQVRGTYCTYLAHSHQSCRTMTSIS